MGAKGGGWYEFPFNENLSIICINSIYWSFDTFEFFSKNGIDLSKPDKQP
jgi:hypothetical protein